MANEIPINLKKHFPDINKYSNKHRIELLVAYHAGVEAEILKRNAEIEKAIAANNTPSSPSPCTGATHDTTASR